MGGPSHAAHMARAVGRHWGRSTPKKAAHAPIKGNLFDSSVADKSGSAKGSAGITLHAPVDVPAPLAE